jgi:hypothetical protein
MSIGREFERNQGEEGMEREKRVMHNELSSGTRMAMMISTEQQ